jgi:hypothetical protein
MGDGRGIRRRKDVENPRRAGSAVDEHRR